MHKRERCAAVILLTLKPVSTEVSRLPLLQYQVIAKTKKRNHLGRKKLQPILIIRTPTPHNILPIVFLFFRHMASRHLSRSIVLQTLFEWDANQEEGRGEIPIEEILTRNINEFAPGSSDAAYMKKLLFGICGKQDDLDVVIAKAAPEWPIERIARLDRNILRLGLYELLFADRSEVPAKVAINEAIELAKNFGSESSSKFVNGVLGAIYKELGEPGKEEFSKKPTPKGVTPIPVDRKAGAVVFARDGSDQVFIALVHDVFGRWTLPKGGIEGEESPEEAVKREIKQEIGLMVSVKERLGENAYIASTPDRGKVKKHVTYYLAESTYADITLEEKGGLDDARWFKLTDILDLNFYRDILPIITKAVNVLVAKN